jgi:hypothetical protein
MTFTGNIIVEKAVPWGVVPQYDSNFFNQRTLWSTRRHAPILVAIHGFGHHDKCLDNHNLPGFPDHQNQKTRSR